MRLSLLTFLFTIVAIYTTHAQYKSIDVEVGISSFGEGGLSGDTPTKGGNSISIFALGYTTSINDQWSVGGRLGLGAAGEQFNTRIGLSTSPGTIPDSTIVPGVFAQELRSTYVKASLVGMYHFQSIRKGLYLEAELQGMIALSATGDEQLYTEDLEYQSGAIDLSDNQRQVVPSLRLGVGYALPINRLILFARLSAEVRGQSYFVMPDTVDTVTPSFSMGFRYDLSFGKKGAE